jgi:hypothetical protein
LSNSNQNISLEVIENFDQNNVAENDEAIFSMCRIWPRDIIEDIAEHDKRSAVAVVRDSSERRLVAV